ISLTHYSMVTNPTLPTVPLFTLAGYFLAEGGASKRLIRVFQALLGQLRVGCDDPGPRRPAHAGATRRRLFRARYARHTYRFRWPGVVVPAVVASNPL